MASITLCQIWMEFKPCYVTEAEHGYLVLHLITYVQPNLCQSLPSATPDAKSILLISLGESGLCLGCCVSASLRVCFVVEKYMMTYVFVPPACCTKCIKSCFDVEHNLCELAQWSVGKCEMFMSHICTSSQTETRNGI